MELAAGIRKRGRPRGDGREKIAEAASHLFRERGFLAVGIDEVMENCAKTAGTFYHHFASKDELILAAIDLAFEQSVQFLTRYLAAWSDRASRWKKWSHFYLSEGHLQNLNRGCPIATLAGEVLKSDEPIKRHFAGRVDDFLWFINNGAAPSKTDRTVLGFMTGTLLLARTLPNSDRIAYLESARKMILVAIEKGDGL